MPRSLPSLNALAALEAAARHGSIARAAEELCVSAAAVSQHIRGLEAQLGVALFARSARGVTATDVARRLLPTLTDALDRMDEATRFVREGATRGRLVVSLLPSLAGGWLVPRLGDFERSFPGVELVVRAERRLVDLQREPVDVAIRYCIAPPPKLAHERLFGEQVFPVCSPQLAYGPRPLRSLADLAHHTLLHDVDAEPDQPFIGWSHWLARAGIARPSASPGYYFDDSMVMIAAAVEGRGVALGREPLVAQQLARGQLCRPLPDALPSEWSYYAVGTKRVFRRPLVRAFIQWLAADPSRMAHAQPT